MRNFKMSEIVLNEMFGLIERDYRVAMEEITDIQFNPINNTIFDWSVDLYFTEDPHEEGLTVAFINKEGRVAYWEDTKELAQRDKVQQAIREKVRCLTETYVSVKYSWHDREDNFFLALDENQRERAIQVALNIVKSYTVDEGQQAELIITEDNEFDTSIRIELSYGTVFIEIINGKKSKNRD